MLCWLTWEFEGLIKPRKQQRPLETCKIHYFFLDLFWVCPLLSINSLQKKQTTTNMKQNTLISRKRARKINPCNLKILEHVLMEVSVWLGAKQTTTGTSDEVTSDFGRSPGLQCTLQGIIWLREGWASIWSDQSQWGSSQLTVGFPKVSVYFLSWHSFSWKQTLISP